ncbi:MAG: hypothetical protein ACHQT8_04280 [Chlamydiales bacterium]
MSGSVSNKETVAIFSAVGAASGALPALLTELPAIGCMCVGGVFMAVTIVTALCLKKLVRDNFGGVSTTVHRLMLLASSVVGVAVTILGAAMAGYSIPIGSALLISGCAYVGAATIGEWMVDKLSAYRA